MKFSEILYDLFFLAIIAGAAYVAWLIFENAILPALQAVQNAGNGLANTANSVASTVNSWTPSSLYSDVAGPDTASQTESTLNSTDQILNGYPFNQFSDSGTTNYASDVDSLTD